MAFNLPPPLTAAQKAERLRLQAIDGAAARAEYDASTAQADDKIARLRALRMERDRLEAEASPPAAKAPRKTASTRQRRNIPIR